MPTNWSMKDLARLRMSVGYSGHKAGRPLSPVEVGREIRKAVDGGATLKECAEAMQFRGTGHIGRFVRILTLPKEIHHEIDWGAKRNTIGFSAAVELAAVQATEDQLAIANAIRSRHLKKKEVRQVGQLLRRTNQDVESCIAEVLAMRDVVVRRYVFVGSIDTSISHDLTGKTQKERDKLLAVALKEIGLRGAVGRLGVGIFTLMGDDVFDQEMSSMGKEEIERKIEGAIREILNR